MLLEKNNIMAEVAGIYFENDVRELSEEQKKRHKELHDRNSEILEELIDLGYAKVGGGEDKKKEGKE